MADVEKARRELGYDPGWAGDKACYFRGQSSGSCPLLPSLYRHPGFKELSGPRKRIDRDDFFWQLESDLFFEFYARARELHSGSLSSWDVLFTMQHFGAPTRLLDWTETFAVALYFATEGLPREGVQRRIWMLNPFRLNALSFEADMDEGEADLVDPKNLGWDKKLREYYGYDEILVEDGTLGFELPVAIYPQLKNARIQAQRGSFTIWGDGYRPLDVALEGGRKRSSRRVLRWVDLDEPAVEEARLFLVHAGIDQHMLFPDLSGLAGWLRRKHGFKSGEG
jgi:hypothetical protein